jgi:hypothetical protein
MTSQRQPPHPKVPITVWQLLSPLVDAERQQIVDAIVEDMPPDRQEAERNNLLEGLSRRPTNARGRLKTIRLLDAEGAAVHHTFVDRVRVTLFELSAPAVRDCQVTIETSKSRKASSQWTIGYKSAGKGSKIDVRSTQSAAFQVNEGQQKRVFVYVPATISRIFELRGSRLQPRNLINLSISPKQAAEMDPPGVETIHSELLPAEELEHYRLLGDTSGDRSTYAYEFERSKDVSASLAMALKGVSAAATATVNVTASVKLTMNLAAGHDYHLHSSASGPGIVWKIR